jgi:hypothetical protein
MALQEYACLQTATVIHLPRLGYHAIRWGESMRMCILSVPLIMFLSRATAVEHANAPQRAPHAAAVAYVLAKVECDNPEEVAALLFADTTEDLFAEPHWENKFDFETEPLGDGTECYVFSPPRCCASERDQ